MSQFPGPSSCFQSPCFLVGGGQRERHDTLMATKFHVSAQNQNKHRQFIFPFISFSKKPNFDMMFVSTGLCTQPTWLHTVGVPGCANTTLFLSFPRICIKLPA